MQFCTVFVQFCAVFVRLVALADFTCTCTWLLWCTVRDHWFLSLSTVCVRESTRLCMCLCVRTCTYFQLTFKILK